LGVELLLLLVLLVLLELADLGVITAVTEASVDGVSTPALLARWIAANTDGRIVELSLGAGTGAPGAAVCAAPG
jgi:hypothetical protein